MPITLLGMQKALDTGQLLISVLLPRFLRSDWLGKINRQDSSHPSKQAILSSNLEIKNVFSESKPFFFSLYHRGRGENICFVDGEKKLDVTREATPLPYLSSQTASTAFWCPPAAAPTFPTAAASGGPKDKSSSFSSLSLLLRRAFFSSSRSPGL